MNYYPLALEFLRDRKLNTEAGLRIRYWQGDYFEWRIDRYIRLAPSDLQAQVIQWLQKHPVQQSQSCTRIAKEIVTNIGGISLLYSEVQPPTWLDSEQKPVSNLIAMKNGIVDLTNLDPGRVIPLTEHSPLFFNFGSLDFPYDPNATCPRWEAFLQEVQPHHSVRMLIQEWFGYNLVRDTSLGKFVLLVGEGANGKSVVCTVMRQLIGESNISAVGLEGFDPLRTFNLAFTCGKLSNIVEELNEVQKPSEGLLKDFVTGGLITVERKHRDPFNFRATARVTFATNTLPRFSDRSDAIWRRMVVIPFRVQILDPTKQDRRLIDPEWWRQSGELPGIFNWAINGLRRLRLRGSFIDCHIANEAIAAFKADANPSRGFLETHCEESSDGKVSSRTLYIAYNQFMKEHGHSPLGEAQFAREIQRQFPNAVKSKQAILFKGNPGVRARAWYGIRFRDSEEYALSCSDTGDTEEIHL